MFLRPYEVATVGIAPKPAAASPIGQVRSDVRAKIAELMQLLTDEELTYGISNFKPGDPSFQFVIEEAARRFRKSVVEARSCRSPAASPAPSKPSSGTGGSRPKEDEYDKNLRRFHRAQYEEECGKLPRRRAKFVPNVPTKTKRRTVKQIARRIERGLPVSSNDRRRWRRSRGVHRIFDKRR